MTTCRKGALALAAALAASVSLAGTAPAGEVSLGMAGTHFGLSVTSLKEARFHRTIRQQYDFSCGSAAIATLLSHHYDRPISEPDAFQAMFAVGNQAQIRKAGFSLLDMQKFLKARGLKADGFRITLDQLEKAAIPAVTLINTNGYNHFVVIKGIRGDEVLIGDPALGMKIVSRDEFNTMSRGLFFVIRDDFEIGQKSFNRDEEWNIRRKAPYALAVERRSIGSFTMMLPGLNEF